MAEAELPQTWSNAGRAALGNSLWILPLVAFERLIEGHFIQAGIAGVAWIVALFAAIQLHVLQEIISDRERRQQLLTWALIIGGAAILAIGIYRLAVQPPSQGINAPHDAEEVRLRQELATTLGELQTAKQELQTERQNRPVSTVAPPPSSPTASN